MSKNLEIIYKSNINSKEWTMLEEYCRDQILGREDILLARVYLILLGIKPMHSDSDLQIQMFNLINENKSRLN